ncbi:MAG: hypothetical protein K2P92_08455, partial [Bdellovibrionaceae bacterium]|nr:hypothetical protein [Pseudobdellovibrionaceae bacterium]
MNKARGIFLVLVVAIFGLAQWDMTRRLNSIETKKEAAKSMAAAPVQPDIAAENAKKTETFIKQFKTEVIEVGRLQANPEAAQARMNKLAAQMTQADVRALADIISDDQQNGDERALAVELLSLKNDTASLTALQNFVATSNKIDGITAERKKEFETVLRAQAVESIADYPQKEIAISTLTYLQGKVDNRFISERIGRASNGLMYGTENLKQQE